MSSNYTFRDGGGFVTFCDVLREPPDGIGIRWRSDSGERLSATHETLYKPSIPHAEIVDQCGNCAMIRAASAADEIDGAMPGEVMFEQFGLQGRFGHFAEAFEQKYGGVLIEHPTMALGIEDECRRCLVSARPLQMSEVEESVSSLMGSRPVRWCPAGMPSREFATLEVFDVEEEQQIEMLHAIREFLPQLRAACGRTPTFAFRDAIYLARTAPGDREFVLGWWERTGARHSHADPVDRLLEGLKRAAIAYAEAEGSHRNARNRLHDCDESEKRAAEFVALGELAHAARAFDRELRNRR